MDIETVSSLLMSAAQSHAAAKRFRFGDGAELQLQQFARRAAAEIIHLPSGEQNQRIKVANSAFTRLIDTMMEQSRTIPGYAVNNAGIIGEETLARALSVVCPLWPFC